jgi:hypothetical protein
MILREDSSIWNQVAPRGRKDRKTDMSKLIVAFRSFKNMAKNTLSATCLDSDKVMFGVCGILCTEVLHKLCALTDY